MIDRPPSVSLYNKFMGGVDMQDQAHRYYNVVAAMLFPARDFASKSGTLILALRTTIMTQTLATKHCFYF